MKLKRFLTASALALSFVVAAPSVAKADPISAAIVTFVGFTGTAATVATFVINSALYAAGSWAVGKAAQALGLVKNAVADRQASVTSLSLGETPRELIVGMACTGGSLADAFNFGGKYGTDTTTRCILLADHILDGLVGYFVDDQYYPYVAGGVQPSFNGKLSIEFRNASPNGWSPPLHVRQNGGWTEADRLTGIAHVWVDTRVDDQVWTQGHPRLRFVVRGLRAYDPRKDAALGYTGPNPHVWSDPATHEFTRNAEVLRYNFQRGVYAAGRHGQPEHLLFGRGLSAEEAPPARSIAAANLCDEQVDGEARYCADGVISAAQTFIEVEEMFAAAMAGVIVQREGGVAVEPGHAKAVVFTITDDDLVVGEPVSFSEFLPDTDGGRVNTVFSRYVEPAQGWKDHGSPPRREQADIIEDGGPRETTLPLMLVISGKQADRCAEIARRRGRLERRASIVLPAEFSEIEEGDWIAWRSDRRHGGATVRYQVTSYSLDAKWRHRLSLEEIASSVYGVPDPVDDRAERPEPPVPVDALQLLGVTAEAIPLSAPLSGPEEGEEAPAAGEEPTLTSTVPAVRFRWDVTEEIDAAVKAIRAEIRVQGTDQVTPTRTEDVGLGVLVTTNGVGPHQTLEARLVPIGEPWRPVLPSPWLIVKTGNLIADDLSQEARDKVVNEVIKDVGADIGAGIEAGKKALERSNGNLRLILQNAKNALGAVLKEEEVRDNQAADIQDRINIAFLIDPVAKTGIIREEVVVEGVDETLVQINTRLVARDNENALQTAQVAIDAQAYTDREVSLATANLVAAAQMDTAISAALLSMEAYADAAAAAATTGLASVAEVEGQIAAANLLLRGLVEEDIVEATAGLASLIDVDGKVAAADLALRNWTTNQIIGATAGLASVAQLDDKVGVASLQLQGLLDAYKVEASGVFATQSSLGDVSSQAGIALSTAVAADGKASATIGFSTTVGGLLSGTFSHNDGVKPWIRVLSSAFEIVDNAVTGERFEIAGKRVKGWYANGVQSYQLG